MVVKEQIGIFQGKKGKYNKLVIMILYEYGCLSAWKIAREIAVRQKRPKSNWYHEAQKVNSVLVRRNGTLERLLDKEFITKKEQVYCLTIFKGLCSALTLYKDLKEPSVDWIAAASENWPAWKRVYDIIVRLHPEEKLEEYKSALKVTLDLLSQGWNIDTVSNSQFNRIFSDQNTERILQEIRGKRENERKWRPNPELQAALQSFFGEIISNLSDDLTRLDKEFKSFTVHSHSAEEESEKKKE